MGATLSALLGSVIVGLLALLWAADFATCFGESVNDTSVRGAADSPRPDYGPRPPNPADPSDARLVGMLTRQWIMLGNEPDSLHVWILGDDDINAASFGQGRFVLWSGLARLPSADLGAVYAHELAHDQLGHSRKAGEVADVMNWLGEAIGTLGGRDEATTETLKRWSGMVVAPTYSRQQELEADRRGVAILGQQYDDSASVIMCRALARIRTEVGEAGGGFFSSHPALSDRIGHLRTDYDTSSRESQFECQ